jgi:hypothetical protein
LSGPNSTGELGPKIDRLLELEPDQAAVRKLAHQLRDRLLAAAKQKLDADDYPAVLALLGPSAPVRAFAGRRETPGPSPGIELVDRRPETVPGDRPAAGRVCRADGEISGRSIRRLRNCWRPFGSEPHNVRTTPGTLRRPGGSSAGRSLGFPSTGGPDCNASSTRRKSPHCCEKSPASTSSLAAWPCKDSGWQRSASICARPRRRDSSGACRRCCGKNRRPRGAWTGASPA